MASPSRPDSPPLINAEKSIPSLPENIKRIKIFYIEVDNDQDIVDVMLEELYEVVKKAQAYLFYEGDNLQVVASELRKECACVLLEHDPAHNGFPTGEQMRTINSFLDGISVRSLLLGDDGVQEFYPMLKKVPLIVNLTYPDNPDIFLSRISLTGINNESLIPANSFTILSFVKNTTELDNLKEFGQLYNVPVLSCAEESEVFHMQNNLQNLHV